MHIAHISQYKNTPLPSEFKILLQMIFLILFLQSIISSKFYGMKWDFIKVLDIP